jgi:hypothetical protein
VPVALERTTGSDQVSALQLANIPSSINTYERLAVWVMQCLQNTSNGDEVNVVDGGGSQPTVQVQLGFTADGVYRFILSGYIPCDQAELNAATSKTWMSANDISTAAPHQNLLSN